MESKSIFKNLRISPKKLRFLLPQVKDMKPKEVLDYLFYSPSKASKILHNAIQSAINNAVQTLKADENLLEFKVLCIEEGHKLKRFRSGSKGNVRPILKRFSHIRIILESVKENKAENKSESKDKPSFSKENKKLEVKLKDK